MVLTVIDAEYQFDRKKLTFYYDAAERCANQPHMNPSHTIVIHMYNDGLYIVCATHPWLEAIFEWLLDHRKVCI